MDAEGTCTLYQQPHAHQCSCVASSVQLRSSTYDITSQCSSGVEIIASSSGTSRASLHRARVLSQPVERAYASTAMHEAYPHAKMPIQGFRLLSCKSGRDSRQGTHERHACDSDGCKVTFGRLSDLKRHHEDIHGRGQTIYRCNHPGCNYAKRTRSDKVREHCRKMRHGSFSALSVDDTVGGSVSVSTRRRRKSQAPARPMEGDR